MRPLTHFPFANSLPRHLSTVTPLQYLNYFQCLIVLYFFTFSVYYHEKYAKIDTCHVASAIFDRKSMELTMVLVFGDDTWRKELFFVDGDGNDTIMELNTPPIGSSSEITIWSSKIQKADEIFIHAEHSKAPLLEDHTGKPKLQIFPQEPYREEHDVVTCMTPVADDLELLLTALTTSISLGSFVHLPYSELSGELYKLLRDFEKSGSFRLLAHPLLKDFEKKTKKSAAKIESIRADLAQLHCYLMYKSKTKFLIFHDSSEPFLPISSGTKGEPVDYFSHFSSIFLMPRVDGYSILEYNARIRLAENEGDFSDFSMQNALSNARTEILSRNSKSFVMKINTPQSTARGVLYTLRNVSPNSKLSPKLLETIDKTIDSIEDSDVFWTLLKSCPARNRSGCSSGKCIRPTVRHRSLQGWYSYDIHFTQFLAVDSFDC